MEFIGQLELIVSAILLGLIEYLDVDDGQNKRGVNSVIIIVTQLFAPSNSMDCVGVHYCCEQYISEPKIEYHIVRLSALMLPSYLSKQFVTIMGSLLQDSDAVVSQGYMVYGVSEVLVVFLDINRRISNCAQELGMHVNCPCPLSKYEILRCAVKLYSYQHQQYYLTNIQFLVKKNERNGLIF